MVMEDWSRVVGALQKKYKALSRHFSPRKKSLKSLEAGQETLLPQDPVENPLHWEKNKIKKVYP